MQAQIVCLVSVCVPIKAFEPDWRVNEEDARCMQAQLSQQDDELRGLKSHKDALAAELHDTRIQLENAASRAEHQVSIDLIRMRSVMACHYTSIAPIAATIYR